MMYDLIQDQLRESSEVKLKVSELLTDHIVQAAKMLISAYQKGGKVLLIGNGGSAADAQHIAGELVGNLDPSRKRRALPAIALTTNSSIITALGNDIGYHSVFARKVEALANHKEDVLIAISTSGNSENILHAVKYAKANSIRTIALTGKGGGKLKDLVDLALVVPSENTQRVQEAHITIGHILCDIIEQEFVNTRAMKSKISAVFLDRDGVINEKMPEGDYVKNVAEFRFLPGAIAGMKLMVREGFSLYLITNQRGIARGLMTEEDLESIHMHMQKKLAEHKINFKGIYFCPHDYGECECRKPKPGMIRQAVQDHGIDIKSAIVIGDDLKDMELAKNAGCRGILIDEKTNLHSVAKKIIEGKIV